MSNLRKQVLLILIGVIVLVLAIIVFILNRRPEDHLLAAIGILGGVAIVIVSLPVRNGGRNGDSR